MKISKFVVFNILLLPLLLIGFSCGAAAAEVNGFFASDLRIEGISRVDGVDTDITDKITISADTYDDLNCTRYFLNYATNTPTRFLVGYKAENLNSTHEYNLKFSFQCSNPSISTFDCLLYYYDSLGNVVKTQVVTMYSSSSIATGWNNVDINFTPDTAGLNSGYTTELIFLFTEIDSNLPVYFRLSEFIELTDKDSNVSELLDILNAIIDFDARVDNSIDRIETSLLSQLVTLDSNIDGYFDDLGGQLVSAITTLDTNIDGYFDILLNGIIANDNALSDKLHEYLDKFKPRFYESFNWIFGRVDSLGQVNTTTDSSAVTSELFIVKDISYYGYFTPVGNFISSTCYIYDLSGNLIQTLNLSPGVTYTLTPGLAYRFQLTSNLSLSHLSFDDLNAYCNEAIVVYAEEGWLTAFRNSLVRGFDEIMNPGVYEEPTTNEWEENKDEFEQIESELPTFDSSDMSEVDISNYSGGFGVVRYLFDRFLSVSGLTPLLAFALTFGLGVFLIGRKVGG